MKADNSTQLVNVALEDPPLEESARTVREGLSAYNRSKGPIDFAKVQAIARDATGAICGGAVGYIAWGELYVDILWVDESARGQGIGTRLLETVEQEAWRRNCHRVHLGTMSHQAPEFYPKVGYTQFAFAPGANGWPDRYHFYKDAPSLAGQGTSQDEHA
jgi:GNAT superfamily N-acetyltransferase